MRQFVEQQTEKNPDEIVNMGCVQSWLIARYLKQLFGDTDHSIRGWTNRGFADQTPFEFCDSLVGWRDTLRSLGEKNDYTFTEIFESMKEYQRDQFRRAGFTIYRWF